MGWDPDLRMRIGIFLIVCMGSFFPIVKHEGRGTD